MRGDADRRGRPLRHRAQRGLRQAARWRAGTTTGPAPRSATRALERGGRRLRQRHRGAWRGFRRHLRGRAGACRRGDRAGGARRRRAAIARRQGGARRHRGRRRDDVPAQPRGAEDGAQGGLSSRPRCSARWARPPASARRSSSTRSRSSMRSASSAPWRPASSNISPKAPGPSACTPAGRRNRACARRCWRGPASPGRARCSKAAHGFFHGFANTTPGQLRRRRSAISARAG